ncbi:hypothetical protein CHARACLAT_009141 [Characodon lateralis]|uniref:Uncharacterized protein n=1 Tax=Characodon lateralis TaxID=208331 RepID=A0ABU7D7L5_9TELE|nr:hypothetical protein [Characodon lateralis]
MEPCARSLCVGLEEWSCKSGSFSPIPFFFRSQGEWLFSLLQTQPYDACVFYVVPTLFVIIPHGEILGCMLTDSTLQIFRVLYLIIYNSNINLLLHSNETVIRCMEREAGGCLCASITDSMHLPLFVK